MIDEPPPYLKRIPPTVPPGRVVVHNHVRPTRRLGQRGFRAWLALPSAAVEICSCGWAPELPEHYRVRRVDWSQCPDAERIEGKLSGAWCVKEHRVRCQDILGQYQAGCTPEEIAGPDIYGGPGGIPLDVVRRVIDFAHPLVRCRSCGWVHIGCPAPEPAGDRCHRCKSGSGFEIVDREEYRRTVPIGVTLQGLRWPR
jgi:uncharacterized protein (DUF433 family)